MSVDPDVMETGQPYSYGSDDPTNVTDPAGDSSVPSLDSAQVKAAASTHAGPKAGCPLVPTSEANFDGSVPVLWHFSTVINIHSILEDQKIDQGPVSGPHARFWSRCLRYRYHTVSGFKSGT